MDTAYFVVIRKEGRSGASRGGCHKVVRIQKRDAGAIKKKKNSGVGTITEETPPGSAKKKSQQ